MQQARDTNLQLKCCSFNCHGFKQSVDYISDCLAKSDVLCLTETWLRPDELHVINDSLMMHPKLTGTKLYVFAKSAMHDLPADYSGRPFGGVAIIVKHNPLLTFTEIVCSSNRIIALNVNNLSSTSCQVITNVYMPYYQRGNSAQTDEFIETIDELQGLIDSHKTACPMKLFGDFNVKL